MYQQKEKKCTDRKIHNSIVEFRKKVDSENYVSIRTKFLGMLLRVAGEINRLREGQKKAEENSYEFQNIVTEEDILMAERIVDHCVRASMIAIGGSKASEMITIKKSGIPEPEQMTIEFLSMHQRHANATFLTS